MRETRVQSLGREDLLEKEMAAHSSTLAWNLVGYSPRGRKESDTTERLHHHMTNDVKPLFCTSLSYIYLLSKYLFKSFAHFKKRLFYYC